MKNWIIIWLACKSCIKSYRESYTDSCTCRRPPSPSCLTYLVVWTERWQGVFFAGVKCKFLQHSHHKQKVLPLCQTLAHALPPTRAEGDHALVGHKLVRLGIEETLGAELEGDHTVVLTLKCRSIFAFGLTAKLSPKA
jgi:hypothetical protein